jgi:hypothetical protein
MCQCSSWDLTTSDSRQWKCCSAISRAETSTPWVRRWSVGKWPLAHLLRDALQAYMKELAMHISRCDFSWVPSAFIHCLSTALDDLALTGI